MARPKNNSEIAKRNRANRQRGSKFEKVVADFLDMDVVPYSGSNARFGYGDVRNSVWLIECKNITMKDGTRVCIKQEWIIDNREKAKLYGLIPIIAWMPAGRSNKYIIMESDGFIKFETKVDTKVEIPKKAVTAVNIFVDINEDWVKSLKTDSGITRIDFDNLRLYMMHIEYFKHLMYKSGLNGSRSTYGQVNN